MLLLMGSTCEWQMAIIRGHTQLGIKGAHMGAWALIQQL
jgi:hypothetical protein